MKKKIIIGTSVLVLIVLFGIMMMPPMITLKGKDMVLTLNEPYKEVGYRAKRFFKDYTKQVIVEDNIDIRKIGQYQVTYTLVYHKKKYQKTRIVKVVDKEMPAITLVGNEEVYRCPNGVYEEEGYQAIDNYDGDLTAKVTIEEKENQKIYMVKDSSGNSTQVVRKIIPQDVVAPVLTLQGGEVTIYQNDVYQEPGYSALDGCDGDLTSAVTVSGTVDSSKAGTYELTYEVVDQGGNRASATRKVVVVKPPSVSGKVIYLTFDDGPSNTITPAVLDILKEENVKATFFVIHRNASLDYLIKRAYDEGHTIALHSYSHNYRQIYTSSADYFADLYAIQGKVKNITGIAPTVIRFPGGSSNTVSRFNPGIMTALTSEVENKGFRYFDWNVDSMDAGGAKTASDVYRNVTTTLTKTHNVVLMHDYENNYKTLNALRDIIHYGKSRGYTFASLTMDTPTVHHRVAN